MEVVCIDELFDRETEHTVGWGGRGEHLGRVGIGNEYDQRI